MEQNKNISLSDILNYDAETYLKKEEISLIQNTFADNPRLINVLRKVLLPSVGDLDMPPEEMGADMWLTGIDWSQIPVAEAKSLAVGRQLAIKFVMGALIKLKVIANQKQETPTQKTLREKKNSNQ